MTALIFEVAWTRQACLIFGNTTLAAATVVAAFMCGLSLGSFVFGRIADRKPGKCLLLYGSLEGIIGIFAIAFPMLINLLIPLYKSIYPALYQNFFAITFIRFTLSFMILLIPTTMMGGTFPLLSRFMANNTLAMKLYVNRLYMLNLAGAVVGTFSSGFIFLGAIGLKATSSIASLLNLAIFAAVMLLIFYNKSLPEEDAGSSQSPESISWPPFDAARAATSTVLSQKQVFLLATILIAIHGFCSFVIQICWTRTMALVLGSSTYSFSAVLATFLAGLALATLVVNHLVKKGIRIGLHQIGFMELGVGAAVILFIPAFEWVIYYLIITTPLTSQSFALTVTAQFILSAIAMIIPTFLIGLVFPSTLYFLESPKDIGKWVGRIYAVNTAGGVIGSLLAASVFISRIGLNGSLHTVSVLSIVTGVTVIVLATKKTALFRKSVLQASGISLLAFMFLFYPWDKNLFSSGAFIYAPRMYDTALLGKWHFQKALDMESRILFYKDGISSTVSVLQHKMRSKTKGTEGIKAKSLRVNGKTDASTIGDMATQLFLGYVPLFAHPNPQNVLVIGLGAGFTLNAVAEFDSVKRIECVEIEPAVVEANRFFASENDDVLTDKRLKMVIGDGRNHLEFSPEKYDVIISEPSNPWISGISYLFTTENYEAALNKLNDNGIYCQWFHAYQMSKDDFVMIIRTFASVFPEVNLYMISTGDYMLLGSRKSISFDYAKMKSIIALNPKIENHLKFFSPYGNEFIIATFLFSNNHLRNMLSAESPKRLNTDNNLSLEYSAPKYLYKSTSSDIMKWIFSAPQTDLYPAFVDIDVKALTAEEPGIWIMFAKRGYLAMSVDSYDSAIAYLNEALKLKTDEPQVLFSLGRAYEKKKDYAKAREYYKKLADSSDENIKKTANKAILRIKIKEDVEKNPMRWRDAKLFDTLGNLAFLSKDFEDAEEFYKRALKIDPQYSNTYANLALFYFASNRSRQGYEMLRKLRKFGPSAPNLAKVEEIWKKDRIRKEAFAVIKTGIMHMSEKRYSSAKSIFEKAVKIDPENYLGYSYLGEAELRLGNKDQAGVYTKKAEELYASQAEKASKISQTSPFEKTEISAKTSETDRGDIQQEASSNKVAENANRASN